MVGFDYSARGRLGKIVCSAICATLFAIGNASAQRGIDHSPPNSRTSFPPLVDIVRGEALSPLNDISAEDDEVVGDFQRFLPMIPPARNLGRAWEIYDTEWGAEDELGYAAFAAAIGYSGCISIDDCLRSAANPYRDLADEELWLGDCTDMVYVLRGYYAWKRGLPFSYEDAVSFRQPSKEGDDLRYSKEGNRIVGRYDVTHPEGRTPRDAPSLLRGLFNVVSTAMLRTHPEDRGLLSSFYPVQIDRGAVKPGIVAYDVFGHVSIVYDVSPEGRVMLISSHPDYTVSREPFGSHVLRTKAALGGGLKAWRPVKLVGARRTAKGTYIGGTIRMVPNEDISDFSMVQYEGTHPDDTGDWTKGRFEVDGRSYPFYDYVRKSLTAPGVPFDPLGELATATDALCTSIRARRAAVNMAIYARVHQQPAPQKLPPNIYGTYGDWERYATPSRDARLKTQAVEFRHLAENMIRDSREENGPGSHVTHDLAAALLDVYDRRANACQMTYTRSDGSRVRLDLDRVMGRLFDLSFDPYHCPEKRWGAQGAEMATCPSDPAKAEWYRAQRFLRYQPARTYDLRTDFPAARLKDPSKAGPEDGGLGRSTPPDVDVRGYLKALAGGHETASSALPIQVLDLSGAVNAPSGDTSSQR